MLKSIKKQKKLNIKNIIIEEEDDVMIFNNNNDSNVREFVLNRCYGGFDLSNFAKKIIGDLVLDREELVPLVKKYGTERVSGFGACLCIVEVPSTITDWMITEYDGLESLIYVIDGKIHCA